MPMNGKALSLTLRQESWDRFFTVLHECGLREVGRRRQELIFQKTGEHWSIGDFWALVQTLEGDFKTATGRHPKTEAL